jgi:hypothetical protein
MEKGLSEAINTGPGALFSADTVPGLLNEIARYALCFEQKAEQSKV